MNELIIKEYDIDYSFIIKNYLDQSLWNKEWTLFVYKDYVFTICLYEINTKQNKICFEVTLNKKNYEDYLFVYYDVNQSNVKILKKQINGKIFDLIFTYEQNVIRSEDGYTTIEETREEEEEMLKNIAEEFLDDNNVTNDDIRDVYIDNYVSNNAKTSTYLSNYLYGRRYQAISDVYLIYTKVANDNERYNMITDYIKNNSNYMEILKEVNEYYNSLKNEEAREEIEEEFRGCLETI